MTNDSLIQKIERAIQLAAKLGEDVFDLIEGRGLHAIRLEIADEIAKLRIERTMDSISIQDMQRAEFDHTAIPQTPHDDWERDHWKERGITWRRPSAFRASIKSNSV